jgi:hypothetical protein
MLPPAQFAAKRAFGSALFLDRYKLHPPPTGKPHEYHSMGLAPIATHMNIILNDLAFAPNSRLGAPRNSAVGSPI